MQSHGPVVLWHGDMLSDSQVRLLKALICPRSESVNQSSVVLFERPSEGPMATRSPLSSSHVQIQFWTFMLQVVHVTGSSLSAPSLPFLVSLFSQKNFFHQTKQKGKNTKRQRNVYCCLNSMYCCFLEDWSLNLEVR